MKSDMIRYSFLGWYWTDISSTIGRSDARSDLRCALARCCLLWKCHWAAVAAIPLWIPCMFTALHACMRTVCTYCLLLPWPNTSSFPQICFCLRSQRIFSSNVNASLLPHFSSFQPPSCWVLLTRGEKNETPCRCNGESEIPHLM